VGAENSDGRRRRRRRHPQNRRTAGANTKAEVRLSIMCGQRGESPTARSRLLANLSPKEAAGLLPSRIEGRVVGLQEGEVKSITLEEVCSKEKPNDLSLLEAAKTLAAQAKQRRGGGKLQRACLLAASRLRLILLLLFSFLFLGFLLLRQAASPLGVCPKMKVGPSPLKSLLSILFFKCLAEASTSRSARI